MPFILHIPEGFILPRPDSSRILKAALVSLVTCREQSITCYPVLTFRLSDRHALQRHLCAVSEIATERDSPGRHATGHADAATGSNSPDRSATCYAAPATGGDSPDRSTTGCTNPATGKNSANRGAAGRSGVAAQSTNRESGTRSNTRTAIWTQEERSYLWGNSQLPDRGRRSQRTYESEHWGKIQAGIGGFVRLLCLPLSRNFCRDRHVATPDSLIRTRSSRFRQVLRHRVRRPDHRQHDVRFDFPHHAAAGSAIFSYGDRWFWKTHLVCDQP